MSADVEHVIDPSHDPEISVFVFARAISGEIHSRNLRPVILNVAVWIAVDGAQHAGPGPLENQESACAVRHWFAIHSHDFSDDSGKRASGRSGLGRDRPRKRAKHDMAGFS